MRLEDAGPHLTYCMNIHPGETAAEVLQNIRKFVVPIKKRISPDRPFGIGLRLSNRAAGDFLEGRALDELKSLLAAEDLYVFTINGFVYGKFHGTRVKEKVYLPDWLDAERLRYTEKLILILGEILPPGMRGSISTSPFMFKEKLTDQAKAQAAEKFAGIAYSLYKASNNNKNITLALEPEPACFPETIDETLDVFGRIFEAKNAGLFAKRAGLEPGEAEAFMRKHLGICYDTCHMAVEFERPSEALARLQAAGIKIQKIQLSSALRIGTEAGGNAADRLMAFDEEVYLHQVTRRDGESITRYPDILPAVQGAKEKGGPGSEWRIHFHVPLFTENLEGLGTTQEHVKEIIGANRDKDFCDHFEVETYTWDVLPESLRQTDVRDSILRELEWVVSAFEGSKMHEAK